MGHARSHRRHRTVEERQQTTRVNKQRAWTKRRPAARQGATRAKRAGVQTRAMARDDAHAPGAASYSVTFSDARVVARSERVRASNGNAPASSARTPSRGIAVATTSNGVALAAYVVGGDVEVTRIRPADGVPSDPNRLRLSSAFDDDDDDDDGAPDFSGAHVCWCAHGIDERDVAVLVATCAAGNIHVVDIIALDDGWVRFRVAEEVRGAVARQ